MLAASRQYLSTAAPWYAFIGLASSMYFSSQGAAKMIGPVLAQTARLVFIALGGCWLTTHGANAQGFFVLAAASMVVLGHAVLRQRDPDALGTDARDGRDSSGAIGGRCCLEPPS